MLGIPISATKLRLLLAFACSTDFYLTILSYVEWSRAKFGRICRDGSADVSIVSKPFYFMLPLRRSCWLMYESRPPCKSTCCLKVCIIWAWLRLLGKDSRLRVRSIVRNLGGWSSFEAYLIGLISPIFTDSFSMLIASVGFIWSLKCSFTLLFKSVCKRFEAASYLYFLFASWPI